MTCQLLRVFVCDPQNRSAIIALRNRRSVNAKAVAVVDRWVQENFKTEGGNVGGWVPLKKQTIDRRRKGKGSGSAKMLQDVGWLRSKWRHIVTDDAAILRSGVGYGIYHDSDKPRSKLPQRRILPKRDEIWPRIKQLFEEHIRNALR